MNTTNRHTKISSNVHSRTAKELDDPSPRSENKNRSAKSLVSSTNASEYLSKSSLANGYKHQSFTPKFLQKHCRKWKPNLNHRKLFMWKEADCKIWPFSQFQDRSLTKSMNQDDITCFLRIHSWKTLTDREFQMGHLKFGKTAMTFSASAVKVSTLVDSIVDLLGSWKLLHKKNIYISKLKSRLRLINYLKILESIWLLRQIPWSSIWSKKSQSKVASIAAIAERKRMERASERRGDGLSQDSWHFKKC